MGLFFLDIFYNLPINGTQYLPNQITVELHWCDCDENFENHPIEKLALFADNLYDYGYRIVGREMNNYSDQVYELTLLRARC